MASITDCVVEGLKYPFTNIKKLLGIGVLFALLSVLSTVIGIKSFDIFRMSIHLVENTNGTVSQIPFSQLPAGDIYLVVGLSVISFIVGLFILGYQYDVVKFSIDKKADLPGFNDIAGLLVRGIKYLIVAVAYYIIPVIVWAVGIAFAGDSSVFIIVSLIAGLLFIIAYFLMIMAVNNMVAYDSIKKAFDFREITDNIANLGWGKYIGTVLFTVIVMMIISAAVGIILSFITVAFAAVINNQAVIISIVIAFIEGLFIDSYMTVFFSRVCGSIYRESIK
ncbi:DUF4013 domain-containing protein [Methanobrevibacter sp.]|uniref:DUF4013 domain-containing protein n=1 Tax=Methanobrevibacter sp. TaxID=66852 RepID=UPI00388EF238